MQLMLANPWGLLGLLGIPAVLLIHLLQRQSRPARCTTMFLLRHLQPESRSGRKIDRIRNSLPLWLQLLTVLVLTWLLVDPRWRRAESVQRVAIVLDSSLSMEAFREGVPAALRSRGPKLRAGATTTEWHILETDQRRPTLYSGRSLELALPEVADWRPRLGAHDVRPALGAARRLVGEEGLVIYVTDHDRVLPPGVLQLNLGEAFGNCGFAGLRVVNLGGVPHWEALVRNYGAVAQVRNWRVVAGDVPGPPTRIELAAGGTAHLRGAFPPGDSGRILLQLDGDRFPVDDVLPVARPQPKTIAVAVGGVAALRDFYGRLLNSIPDRQAAFVEPDVMVDHYRGEDHAPPYCGIWSLPPMTETRPPIAGEIVAENHALVADLNWQGLLLREIPGIALTDRDQALLWQGGRPLAVLRSRPSGLEDLILNFDLETGNAGKQPAVVLLMHRFIERRRALLLRDEVANVEQNQLLQPRFSGGGRVRLVWEPALGEAEAAEVMEVPPESLATMRAPMRPGFFRVEEQVGEAARLPLSGAVHFADALEADFAQAGGASDDLESEAEARIERHTRPDPLAPAWLLLAGVLPAWCWYLLGRPEDEGGRG